MVKGRIRRLDPSWGGLGAGSIQHACPRPQSWHSEFETEVVTSTEQRWGEKRCPGWNKEDQGSLPSVPVFSHLYNGAEGRWKVVNTCKVLRTGSGM